jgi:TPR repeat protein
MEIHAALRRLDGDAARRLLAEAEARGQRGADLDYYRGLLRLQEGDLEGALSILRPLAAGPPGTVRDEARARAASAARVLGRRHAAGYRVPPNPLLGLAYLDEACALGDGESCRQAEALRTEIAR